MFQFLYPWWFLSLPLALIPWLWPLIRPSREEPHPFSTLFLFPKEALRRHFEWSLKEWFIKLLRSLLILLLILLLAKPYWGSSPQIMEVRIIDDTPSTVAQNILNSLENTPITEKTITLSELFPKENNFPFFHHPDASNYFSGSPSLAEIASMALKKFGANDNERIQLKLRLLSDFQYSQYWFYHASVKPVLWEFEHLQGLKPLKNLSLRNPSIKTSGLFNSKLFIEIYGNIKERGVIHIDVEQENNLVGETVINWKGNALKTVIPLSEKYQRKKPVQILFFTKWDQPRFDDVLHFQEATTDNLLVGIMTSEGPEGMYRHGLHALKAALNAIGVYSFLVSNSKDLKQLDPDILLLLGDHPKRWEELENIRPFLFIPTRLQDWKEYAVKLLTQPSRKTITDKNNLSLLPDGQWVIDWRNTPLGQEWSISKRKNGFFQSGKNKMLILETGVSATWGKLYQQDHFVDIVKNWLLILENDMTHRSLGTFSSGTSLIPHFITGKPMDPGHYLLPNSSENQLQKEGINSSILSFSINQPGSESEMKLMSDMEIRQMKLHFEENTPQLNQDDLGTVETFKKWMLWIALCIAFFEIIFIIVYKKL